MSEPVLQFSDPCDKIAAALKVAQDNLGDVKKNATNPHFKSKYADLGAVLDAVWPALEKAGIALLQPPAGRIASDNEYYVVVETVLLHTSGQRCWSQLTLPVSKSDPQGAGSAITYGRRYAVQSFFGLTAEDDDGNAASRRPAPPAAAPRPQPAPAQIGAPIGDDVRAKFMALYGSMPPAEFEATIKEVQAHYKQPPTGQVADLHEGGESRDAYKFLSRKAKEFANVERV